MIYCVVCGSRAFAFAAAGQAPPKKSITADVGNVQRTFKGVRQVVRYSVRDAGAGGRTRGRKAHLAGRLKPFFSRRTAGVQKYATVQREFGRLTKDDPRFDVELRTFFGRAYNLKAIADYETGSGSRVSAASASAAVQTARRFADCVANFLLP